MQSVLKIYSNCIFVEGATRTTICDIQKGKVKLIPNEVAEILKNFEGKSKNEIFESYPETFETTIFKYINFLIDNDFAFLTDTPIFFPNLNLQWHEPFEITNAVIDINNSSDFDCINIVHQLNDLNCKHIEIRYFKCEPRQLNDLMFELEKISSIIHTVDIYLDYDFIDLRNLKELIKNYGRLNAIVIYNCPDNIELDESDLNQYLTISSTNISSKLSCGKVKRESFVLNMSTFTESQIYNTCLNRKISIDSDGYIRNCPSMPKSFGNVNDNRLIKALNHPEFKKYWNITKDQIEVCKDCEFRHICTDCRAYVEEPDNQYSKPLKCGYNPYTNVWEEWSTNPLKQKAIEYYGMQDLIKKDA